ncbi:hypothetical protein [Gracilibacillus xinjiangensis]|uniref:Uncharacterized protein n=1 Tax=Gracilibacillus xinjiangensis TaxID=1193282 RepID=A0ABV8WY88_9BACI
MTYEDTPDINYQMYATAIMRTNDKRSLEEAEGVSFKTWGYGLYNHTENEANIKDAYTRIFKQLNPIFK